MVVIKDKKKPPRKLLRAVREAGSERAYSRKAILNIKYISDLIHRGIEPTDKTEKGRTARVKLFLPRKKPKPRKPRKPLTLIQKAIRQMVAETRRYNAG